MSSDPTVTDPMLPQGTDRCRCGACGLYFGSAYAFGKHRAGPFAPIGELDTRRCFTADELTAAGWSQGPLGHWRTPSAPGRVFPQREPADPRGNSDLASAQSHFGGDLDQAAARVLH